MANTQDKILLLFDIDGTLINSKYKNDQNKSHGHYIIKALAQVFLGDPERVDQITSEGVHMPGGTDGSICLDLLCHNKLITEEEKINPSEELWAKIDYTCNIISAKQLACDIRSGQFQTEKCPNVDNLLEKLSSSSDPNYKDKFVVGLLTGNYAVCAKLKLESAGIKVKHFMEESGKNKYSNGNEDKNFELNYDVDPRNENQSEITFVGSFGSDNFVRRKLPPIAVQRFEEKQGQNGSGNKVDSQPVKAIIIGDTPKDIDCAKFNGLKSIGVATGYYSAEALRECGGDVVLDDFNDVEGFVKAALGLF